MASYLDNRSPESIIAARAERVAYGPVNPKKEAAAQEIEAARRVPELVDHHIQTEAEAKVAAAALQAANNARYEEFDNQPEPYPKQGSVHEFAD